MINFPTSLDTLANPTGSNTLNSPDHALQHSNANDAVEALEAKVGVDGSAVTTSHDYKLSGVTGTDKAVSKTGVESLTNKTLTSPVINVGSDGTGDMYYRNSGGAVARLAIGSAGQILDVSSGGLPEWVSNPAAADASTTVKGVIEIATQSEADAGTASGGTSAPLVTRTSNIRARNYNDYVIDTGSANAYAIAPTPAITAYADGQIFTFKAINANTTASTLAVNGLTAKAIRKNYNVALAANDILAGQRVLVIYDATNDFFQMLSSTPSGGSFVTGVLTDFVGTTTGNNDATVTTTFTPRLIKLYYYIQGWDGAGATGYTGRKGIAIYNGTTLQSDTPIFNADSATNKMTGDDGTPNALTAFSNISNSTSAPTATGTGGVTMALSIASVSSTTCVIRRASTGDSTHNARAKIAYEIYA